MHVQNANAEMLRNDAQMAGTTLCPKQLHDEGIKEVTCITELNSAQLSPQIVMEGVTACLSY